MNAALLEKARALGADLAGIAAVDDLRDRAGRYEAVARDSAGLPRIEPEPWPEGARSILVVAVEHPRERPELDWWFGRVDPPGNRVLARIVQGLFDWVTRESGIRATHLPYHVERGGIYLKDAAVLAGLGCIGLSNLLVTPEYGPRVRLRALAIDAPLTSTGPSTFDPCATCDVPCRHACPQGAFVGPAARPAAGVPLPARTGEFSRAVCNAQMERDIAEATLEDPVALGAPDLGGGAGQVRVIRYCRACELSCPVGRAVAPAGDLRV